MLRQAARLARRVSRRRLQSRSACALRQWAGAAGSLGAGRWSAAAAPAGGRRALTASAASRAPAAAAAASEGKDYVRVEVDDEKIATVTIDDTSSKVNTLSTRLNASFEAALQQLEAGARSGAVRAVVLASGKAGPEAKSPCFVAGADIGMLAACSSAQELADLSRQGQRMMDRLEALHSSHGVPVVAAISGDCLGGGLELAMACSYRVASSHPKTKLGLPEVQLGLLPGAGGTQRLWPLVGVQQAIKMTTTGQRLDAARAKKAGLVDAVADPHALEHAARVAARGLADGSIPNKGSKRKGGQSFPRGSPLENNPIGRQVLWHYAQQGVDKQAPLHAYPAVHAILACIKAGVEGTREQGLKKEAEEFGRLGMTSQSRALRGLFFAQQGTKSAKGKTQHPLPRRVAVLGAGLMGAGVAEVTAHRAAGQGVRQVVLKDTTGAGLARGERQVAESMAGLVKRRRMRQFEADQVCARVLGVSSEDARGEEEWARLARGSEAVIEAVFEDLGLKQRIFGGLEREMHPDAVLATNTSALPIEEVAKGCVTPEGRSRVVGMHYFSPVPKMPLLEIIPHSTTSPAIVDRALALGMAQGKTCIVVKDVPGFYVNRCLGPYMDEVSALMMTRGVELQALDRALGPKGFGFPVGPVTLADEVGLDVALKVQEFLGGVSGKGAEGAPGPLCDERLGNRMGAGDPSALRALVEEGHLGRKSGAGLFQYSSSGNKGKVKKAGVNPRAQAAIDAARAKAGESVTSAGAGPKGEWVTEEAMAERIALRFTKEALLCLQEGIIRNAGDGDIGAVFGVGFAPFKGGPFMWCDEQGAGAVADKMARWADRLGEHYAPPQILLDHAKAGDKKFRG